MKTLLLLLTGMTLCLAGMAQTTVIKVQPAEPLTDSITYQTENVMMVFKRQDLMDYMIGMDTSLRQNKYNNRTFRHIQFVRLSPTDMASHFRKAYCYLEDTNNKDFSFSTDKMNMFWAEDGGILLPYVEEILPGLLAEGRLRVTDRMSKAAQPAYRMIQEPVDNNNYRVFRLTSGKEIFRESTFCVEQITRR
ncbi:hypothetical protein [Chitinophaga nivalis]|uniref:GLPGLI family protein n=1 Tax=Chitinophaga nivalis TaxID=2991709 RepID=A0ABT3IGI5_9BACT|nr:hypothetical protein [Chitinophaga nivalis]MCW3467419.1 hypothetical protein [Chitinophaga nivalis]MCW3482889.1 hypothetical protein [Chitinophaga nivalis]